MPSPHAHGHLTVVVGLEDRVVVAHDPTADAAPTVAPERLTRAVEIEPGFVVAASGIWSTSDGCIDAYRDIIAAYRMGDTAEAFLQRYDRLYRHVLEGYLTARFRTAPDTVLRDCFCPLTPPQSLVVCEAATSGHAVTIFEYIPTLTSENTIALTPLTQSQPTIGRVAFGAVGAAAPFVDLLDRQYIEQALNGPRGPEYAAATLIDQASARMSGPNGPAEVRTFLVRPINPRVRIRQPARAVPRPTPAPPAPTLFPPVDTKDITAVEAFVEERYAALFPNARFAWLPTVFRDVANYFAGHDPDYSAVDLRYHDLEHTLQATVCVALILAGRHAARAAPRLDAHHFELAITAALLHDAGYLKLRTDNRGTGAKYTFCHVLRGCAFAASYLPTIGANANDVETVMSAINCTGPMNEISRLRFQAPIDEIIGCSVATADYLGQMAARDYPDELEILFEEFQESDDFLHVPVANRMFKSGAELIARTPQFWHRYVLPKLESDFRGVYRYLAKPLPDGPNLYVEAVEKNITEVQRRLRTSSLARLPLTDAPPPAPSTMAENSPSLSDSAQPPQGFGLSE